MLAGSESDLQRMLDRLIMVSVNYNMKINTKKTNVLRVIKQRIRISSEDSICWKIIEQVKEFCYLGKMISDDATEKFPKNFNFFRQFYKRISSFAGKFPKILIFSGNYKNSIFQAKKLSIYSYLWAN